MYRLLSSRSGLIKDLTIDDKTYEVRISDRYGHEIKKSGLSAGEKEVFAISLLWGLAQTSQLKLPIIIDTPLSRLDSTHRDNIVNNYFPNAGEQVVILSTDTEIDTNYYQQDFFNFQELLEFAYIFQCEMVAAGSVQKILGCASKTAKELQTEIARLEPWQVVSRSPDKTEEFVKFTAEVFFKSY